MEILVRKEVRGLVKETEWLRKRALRHLRKLSLARVPGAAALKKVQLSLVLTSDATIQELNRRWRAKDKATDVLSFPLLDAEGLKALARLAAKPKFLPWELGDIVISVDTAKAQAKEHGHSLAQELDLLLVHGILHLLGFDHELGLKEEALMRRWERELLQKKGLVDFSHP